MFRAVSRPIVQACVCLQRRTPPIISSSACRNLSLISVHKSFPASLLRLSPRQESGLFDCSKKMDGLHDPDDGVLISKDGWVYPAVLESPLISNGTVFRPNTYTMQEIVRLYVDYYFEDLENGKPVEKPVIFRVRKGTPIPDNLILFHERDARLSLQPSSRMTINDLNGALDKFLAKHAEIITAEEWLDQNDFNSAVPDDAVEDWTRI